MRYFRSTLVGILLIGLMMSVTPSRAAALNSNVTIGVGDTILIVEGYTSPSAFVEISQNGSVIASTSSDANGFFSSTLTAQTPGIRDLTVSSTTPAQHRTDDVIKNIDVVANATTQVEFFLPPTIEVYTAEINQGQTVTISGSGRPVTTLKIIVDSGLTYTATVDSSGYWTIDVPTAGLNAGTHNFVALLNDTGGQISSQTMPRTFTIASTQQQGSPTRNRGRRVPALPVQEEPIDTIFKWLLMSGLVFPSLGGFIGLFAANHFRLIGPHVFIYWWQLVLATILMSLLFLVVWWIFSSRKKQEE